MLVCMYEDIWYWYARVAAAASFRILFLLARARYLRKEIVHDACFCCTGFAPQHTHCAHVAATWYC